MKQLAQLAFDHLWLVLFGDEDVIDLHYSVQVTEAFPSALALFTPAERDAMADVGRDVKSQLLAEPDEYGYTPRALVTDEQRRFLDAVINKEIYCDEWWTD